jgi:acyl-CoA thioesterase-1
MPAHGQSPDPARGAQLSPILILGDSLSAEYGIARNSGWVELLRKRLRDRGDLRPVVNVSVSGETSAGGRSRIEGLLKRHQPSIVVLELGGNDALRGLDLASTRANLLHIARASQAVGAKVLILGMKVPPNYGRAYSDAFERVFGEVAKDSRSALVPFFLEGIAERLEFFQADRIHPNEAAQPIMLDRVWPSLEASLK